MDELRKPLKAYQSHNCTRTWNFYEVFMKSDNLIASKSSMKAQQENRAKTTTIKHKFVKWITYILLKQLRPGRNDRNIDALPEPITVTFTWPEWLSTDLREPVWSRYHQRTSCLCWWDCPHQLRQCPPNHCPSDRVFARLGPQECALDKQNRTCSDHAQHTRLPWEPTSERARPRLCSENKSSWRNHYVSLCISNSNQTTNRRGKEIKLTKYSSKINQILIIGEMKQITTTRRK